MNELIPNNEKSKLIIHENYLYEKLPFEPIYVLYFYTDKDIRYYNYYFLCRLIYYFWSLYKKFTNKNYFENKTLQNKLSIYATMIENHIIIDEKYNVRSVILELVNDENYYIIESEFLLMINDYNNVEEFWNKFTRYYTQPEKLLEKINETKNIQYVLKEPAKYTSNKTGMYNNYLYSVIYHFLINTNISEEETIKEIEKNKIFNIDGIGDYRRRKINEMLDRLDFNIVENQTSNLINIIKILKNYHEEEDIKNILIDCYIPFGEMTDSYQNLYVTLSNELKLNIIKSFDDINQYIEEYQKKNKSLVDINLKKDYIFYLNIVDLIENYFLINRLYYIYDITDYLKKILLFFSKYKMLTISDIDSVNKYKFEN